MCLCIIDNFPFKLLRSNDDVELEKIQTSLLADMPNTYTMTKRCSEALVNHRAHCLPAAIFRPPIGKIMNIINYG